MRRALPEVQESVEDLQSLLGKTNDAQHKRRVHLLLLVRTGKVHSRLAAAAHLAVHRNSVGDWLEKYEKGGLSGMLDIGKRGAKPRTRVLSTAALEALKARLGAEGFDSYTQVREWLGSEFGADLRYSTLHRIVRYRLQSKLKRARPRHVKKTPSRAPSSPGG